MILLFDQIVLGPIHKDFVTFKKICEWGHAIGLGDKMCIGTIEVNNAECRYNRKVSLFFTSMFVSGFILAFPFVFREFWKFIKPALTNNELKNKRSYLLGFFPVFFGVLFGYYILMPFSMNFLATFTLADSY